jgi:tRNA threonylcarbamoyladenosine biosynthesis protein TsaB
VKIIAIDTAEETCSAALYLDGEVISRYAVAPRRHSALVLPMMDELLAEAGLGLTQLDGMAFGRGPGSFTGLRIAAGVTQGAAFGADLPVAPVSTLAALAQRAKREQGADRVLAAFDARMGEVYWAACTLGSSGLMQVSEKEIVARPAAVPAVAGTGWVGAGSGWGAYSQDLGSAFAGRVLRVDADLRVHAHDVASLGAYLLTTGKGVAPEHAIPVYLRDEVAWKKTAEQPAP